ncbi:MAG: pyridoxamine 5'-phosphate oxidase family protein [Acidimicrobiia bacterium]
MARRAAIRMSAEEVLAFLEESRTINIATVGPDGSLHVVAMWYVVDRGQVVFWTDAKSQKVRNLQRDPRLTGLVEAGETYGELRGVELVGRVELVDDPDEVRRIGEAVSVRYVGPLTDESRAVVERRSRNRVAVRLHAERTVSWDHRKIASGS